MSTEGDAGSEAERNEDPLADLYDGLNNDVSPDPVEDLRMRADSLLDEMMLGAVDVSAGANGGGRDRSHNGAGALDDVSVSNGANTDSSLATSTGNGYGSPAEKNGSQSNWTINGSSGSASDFSGNGSRAVSAGAPTNEWTSEPANSEPGLNADGPSANGHVETARNGNVDTDEALSPVPTPEWRVKSGGGDAGESDSAWSEYVGSFQPSADSERSAPKWQPEPTEPRSEAYGHNVGASAYENSGRESGYDGAMATDVPGSAIGRSAAEAGLGTVSSMVAPIGPKRTGLLPRESRFDVDKLNREIAELHVEIRVLLPVGHDHAERAQHLLDKAHTIAASDPQRSAEVEYYMQQVRSIVERTRQSRRWSDLYRSRLRTYLLAWTLLSTLTLAVLMAAQFEIEAMVAGLLTASADGLMMRNYAGLLGGTMAGALGGSLGALLNMRKHGRTQHGFFDRKYGLRGLMLPIIGALAGVLTYALFGIIYFFAGINPSLSIVAMAVPALIAFVFGYSQESIYGTND